MSETTNKLYNLPTVGGDFNTWGNQLNANWGILDKNLGGEFTANVSGNTNYTLSVTNAQNLIINMVGTLTGAITFFIPQLGGFYIFANNTAGSFQIFVATGTGGTSVAVPQGTVQLLICDSSNVFQPASPTLAPSLSGGWNDVSGSRALGVNGTNALGKPIAISVNVNSTGTGSPGLTGVVNGGDIVVMPFGSGITNIQLIVPTGGIYRIDANGVFSPSLISWLEFF